MPEVLTRASLCFFIATQLMQLWKHPSSSKATFPLSGSHCCHIPCILLRHTTGGHFVEGDHRWLRELPDAQCGFTWVTPGWSTDLCGFAHCDSPCSRMYFTISPCPVLAAWCNKEQWSGPRINKLAPFLQHSMNWKKKPNQNKNSTGIIWEEQKNKYAGKLFIYFHRSVQQWNKMK